MSKGCYKKTNKWLILGFLVFVFLVATPPIKTYSEAIGTWKNPNTNGSGPFQLSADNIMEYVVEKGLITQVIGCTGAIDKVAGVIYKLEAWGANLLSHPASTIKAILGNEETVQKICTGIKGGSKTSAGGAVNLNLYPGLDQLINCGPDPTRDKTLAKKQEEMIVQEKKNTFVEQCLGGIAVTLAKNQLTTMARSTMNWINAGFDGNPFFVQSARSVLNSVERNIVEPAILGLSDQAFPYGEMYARAYVNRFKNKNTTMGDRGLLGNLVSNMANYVIVDYTDNPNLSTIENQRIREEKAIEKFSEDFSSGGWNGWLKMTMGDENNPLGFYSKASRIISQEVEDFTQDVINEANQGGGYLSQKECTKWQVYNKNGTPKTKEETSTSYDSKTNQLVYNKKLVYDYSETKDDEETYDYVCLDQVTITPGSVLHDKTREILETPTRQIELANDINDTLNSVFSVLLYAIQNQGLPGLTSGDYAYTSSGNVGVTTFSNSASSSSSLDIDTESNYTTNGSFDITRDLGNTFIYDYNEDSKIGEWDANLNKILNPKAGDCFDGDGQEINCPTKLTKGLAPNDCFDDSGKNKISCHANVYYTVEVAGKTDLIQNGYSGWAVGDRAFWDGNSWQNWKCRANSKGECTVQKNPIKKRGVLQIQEDYSIVAKEMLKVLPTIMPALGELDYCIPGPNPSWQVNSSDAYTGLVEIANAINADYTPSGLKINKNTRYYFPKDGDELYENYQKAFNNLDGEVITKTWNKVIATWKWNEMRAPAGLDKLSRKDENTDQDERQDDMVQRIINGIAKESGVFYKRYNEIINSKFGFGEKSLLWEEFIEREDSARIEKNPAYIPMIKAGSEITSAISLYEEEVEEKTDKYKDAIQTADSNIYKLNEIKNEVSKIITQAQDRRAKEMIEKIKEEEGLAVFTIQDFENRYKDCLDEEDIKFYEDIDITDNSEDSIERCSDGIDNDLDGFLDQNDADCNGLYHRTSTKINLESNYGSLASSGKKSGEGYNTRTNEEEYNEQDGTTDPTIEVIWRAQCDKTNIGKCIFGNPTEVTSDDLKYYWTCESRGGETRTDSCDITREITDQMLEQKKEQFKNELLDGKLNVETIEYILEGYKQKAERLVEGLGDEDSRIVGALEWILDKVEEGEDSFVVKAIVWVAKRLGNLLDVGKFLLENLPQIIASLSSLAGSVVSLEKLGVIDWFSAF